MADPAPSGSETLVVLSRDGMGDAEPALAHKLLGKWLELTRQNGDLPGAIAFYARGVHLVVEGSPVLEALRRLEEAGTHLIVCATCLEFYGLRDRVAVGLVGGMGDIIAAQTKARKVITL